MPSRKIIYALIGIIAISIFSNYLLYQKTQLLEQTVDYYKKQNTENLEKPSKITLVPKQVTVVPQPNNQTITHHEKIVSHASNYTSSESITAVAVRPVLESD